MRHLTLSGVFLILMGALYVIWNLRFERSPEFQTFHLADLRKTSHLPEGAEWSGPESHPTLMLRADPAKSGMAIHFDLPVMKPVDFLHVRFQVAARQLVPGSEYWQDGRAMIEWHPADGRSKLDYDPFASARENDLTDVTEMVMRPDVALAVPSLRVENLGVGGEFEIRSFEASVLRERMIWKAGRWILVAAWIAWAVAWIRSFEKPGLIRELLAACVWLLMGIYFVVPGPWKSLRALGTPFVLAEAVTGQGNVAEASSPAGASIRSETPGSPFALESVGQIPNKGDFTLRLKLYAENARSLLHAFLLFGPTLVSACLVGRKASVTLAIVLALCIEAAQYSFGFGFDRVDVFDLACDAVGILAALGVHRYLRRKFPHWIVC